MKRRSSFVEENPTHTPPKKLNKKNFVERKNGHKSGSNEYVGWRVPYPNYIIPTISDDEKISATKIFKKYISQRRPVLFKNYIPHDLSRLELWKTSNEHMKKHAGSQKVKVERRGSVNDSFGKGNEVEMLFSEFVDLIESGDPLHYLTTQDVECNNDGQPDLMAPFMKALSEMFPLRPQLMGNLIPQNINLWMGNNKKEGASSGLHHDYHDNLYIVLRGRKRFRLYSPFDTEKMYTRGTLHKVHPNGRINYEGEVTTPYGADLKADAAAKASKDKDIAEKRLIQAEKNVSEGRAGAMEELEKAEEMLQLAMDALIDAEMEGSSYGDDEYELNDLFNKKNEHFVGDFEEEEDSKEWNEDLSRGSRDSSISVAKEPTEYPADLGRHLVDKTVKNPNNFSKIDADILGHENELLKAFPNVLKANAAFCDLNAGDMLYLPASWFHEVTSFGEMENESAKWDTDSRDRAKTCDSESLGHLAMNYWFHPPDNLENFDQPYTTEFWPNDYKLRSKT